MEPLAQGGGGSSDPPEPPPPLATGLRRESISRRTAEMETPDRPVASHPGGEGGGGSELGWVEHYRSIQGMVGLSRIMGETRSLAPIRRGWLISHSGAYFHLYINCSV